MAFGEGEPGSVEEARHELNTITPILTNREAWIARAGFLSGWLVAKGSAEPEEEPTDG